MCIIIVSCSVHKCLHFVPVISFSMYISKNKIVRGEGEGKEEKRGENTLLTNSS